MEDDLLDADYAMPALTEPRPTLFTLPEAHTLLDLLDHFSAAGDDWGTQAGCFAAELAARAPSREA
ncbi:hypothetical protein [Streptomyces sp. NPDC001083]|uniref:hypothetical protein n=1 Tax=Streptomyces sp. NPDC001083 TaxID=3364545 RepID=UPI003677DB31